MQLVRLSMLAASVAALVSAGCGLRPAGSTATGTATGSATWVSPEALAPLPARERPIEALSREELAAEVAKLDTTLRQQHQLIQRLSTELAEEKQKTANPLQYRIGPGDVLEVSVWKNPDVSRTVAVGPAGTISLPLLGQIQADGLTPEQLDRELTEKFAEYIPNPEVSVLVQQVHSYAVSVIGQATKPGRYELQRPTTVLEAIALAGGLGQFASRRGIFVMRNEGGATKRIPFDYGDAISDEGAEANFYLHPGDIVVVP